MNNEIKGYIHIEDPEIIEDYKKGFQYKEEDGKVLFPFTYITNCSAGGFFDRCYKLFIKDETI